MDRNNHTKKFDEVLLDSIDEALSSLGESVKKSIYFHLENSFLIPKLDIPHRIADFSNALERVFGSGAKYLELLIMKNLYMKANCSYKWKGPKWLVPDLTFEEYIKLVRISYEAEEKIGTFEVIIDAGEKQEQRE